MVTLPDRPSPLTTITLYRTEAVQPDRGPLAASALRLFSSSSLIKSSSCMPCENFAKISPIYHVTAQANTAAMSVASNTYSGHSVDRRYPSPTRHVC